MESADLICFKNAYSYLSPLAKVFANLQLLGFPNFFLFATDWKFVGRTEFEERGKELETKIRQEYEARGEIERKNVEKEYR